jgi:hypothetical protein
MSVASSHAVGARRMWVRRWLKSGKISKAEASRLTQELETMKVRRSKRESMAATASDAGHVVREKTPKPLVVDPAGLISVQFDPSRYRVEFHRIRAKAARY